ncbi:MAG: DUF2071 domain-containing protein [Actinomycetota bacterium]
MTAVLERPIPSAGAGPVDVPAPHGTPIRRAVMVQRWTDLVFLHWRYPADAVAALLPEGLVVDTFDGDAWIGLIPFRMEGLGLPRVAPLPHVGAFPEINVRTYVRAGGRRGVWFFSLDVDRMLPAVAARVGYRLPYCAGAASHERTERGFETHVERRWPKIDSPATTHLVVEPGEELIDDPLAHFLTDRWRLFSAGARRSIRTARVDHPPWPLRVAEPTHVDDRLILAAGLPSPTGSPHAMWSPGVDVRVGRPRRARLVD